MSFINDFLEYNAGSECPRNFLLWASIYCLSVASGRRFILQKGMTEIRPQLYIKYVGLQGSRKSWVKDKAKELVQMSLLDKPIGADITSREDVIRFMSSKDTSRFYITHEGAEVEWHPLALFIDEFKNFVSFAPSNMINFIVNIYNQRALESSTLKRGVEMIQEPHLTILACENPTWMINNLKMGILTGGYSRRFIIIYEEAEKNRDKFIAESRFIPTPSPNEKVLWDRMKQHLQRIDTSPGKVYTWESPATLQFCIEWYAELRGRQFDADEMMKGFLSTLDEQVCRVAMLLDQAEDNPVYLITKENFMAASSLFDLIIPALPKLFMAAGRNELALPQHRLMEFIESKGGAMSRMLVTRFADGDFTPMEQLCVLRHLVDSGRLFETTVTLGGEQVKYVMTTEKYEAVKKAGGKFTV